MPLELLIFCLSVSSNEEKLGRLYMIAQSAVAEKESRVS